MKCFKTAYGYAEKIDNFDTYQIDNHYARLIIESSLANRNQEEVMNASKEAHNIILAQLNRPNFNKHYPFRVASLFINVVNTFKLHLSESEKSMFIGFSNDYLKKIQSLPYNFSQNNYVVECKSNMEKIYEMLTNKDRS
jgi:hypothetical protein